MRKILTTAFATTTLLLGGCATGYGGNPIGAVLGSVLGGAGTQGGYDTNRLNDFERAAANACAREASRYGRISLERVEQRSRDIVRVDGRIDSRDRNRDQFLCEFRSDGRIVNFRTG